MSIRFNRNNNFYVAAGRNAEGDKKEIKEKKDVEEKKVPQPSKNERHQTPAKNIGSYLDSLENQRHGEIVVVAHRGVLPPNTDAKSSQTDSTSGNAESSDGHTESPADNTSSSESNSGSDYLDWINNKDNDSAPIVQTTTEEKTVGQGNNQRTITITTVKTYDYKTGEETVERTTYDPLDQSNKTEKRVYHNGDIVSEYYKTVYNNGTVQEEYIFYDNNQNVERTMSTMNYSDGGKVVVNMSEPIDNNGNFNIVLVQFYDANNEVVQEIKIQNGQCIVTKDGNVIAKVKVNNENVEALLEKISESGVLDESVLNELSQLSSSDSDNQNPNLEGKPQEGQPTAGQDYGLAYLDWLNENDDKTSNNNPIDWLNNNDWWKKPNINWWDIAHNNPTPNVTAEPADNSHTNQTDEPPFDFQHLQYDPETGSYILPDVVAGGNKDKFYTNLFGEFYNPNNGTVDAAGLINMWQQKGFNNSTFTGDTAQAIFALLQQLLQNGENVGNFLDSIVNLPNSDSSGDGGTLWGGNHGSTVMGLFDNFVGEDKGLHEHNVPDYFEERG